MRLGCSPKEIVMKYLGKDFSKLFTMKDFSETLLQNHFILYQGYVKNVNRLSESLDTMFLDGHSPCIEYAKIKRRLGWEFNCMRLHELYFESLGGNGIRDPESPLSDKVGGSFGHWDQWEDDFKSKAAERGDGWVGLFQDKTSGHMRNHWMNECDSGYPDGYSPILIMDVYEHAFKQDYGSKCESYIDAFFSNIDWMLVGSRMV